MRDAETQTDMTHEDVRRRKLVPGETARLGEEIYERDIRGTVEKEHVGKVVAIDVDTGCWALGDNAREAAGLLRQETPETEHIWLERVGYLALRSHGAGSLRRVD